MTTDIPGPAYRIQTSRMVLRCWEPADAPALKQAVDENLEHLRPWMPWIKYEPTDLQAKIATMRRFRGSFDQGNDFVYGVFNRDETLVLGGTGLHIRTQQSEWAPPAREIGYWIHKDHLNKGLATELSAALTKVAFEIEKVDRVEILCDPENIRSSTVPRKLGYILEATLRYRTITTDRLPRDTMIWSLFASTYPESPAAETNIQAFDAIGRRIL